MKDINGFNVYTEIDGEQEIIQNICSNLNNHGVSLLLLTDAIRKSAVLCDVENRKEMNNEDIDLSQIKDDIIDKNSSSSSESKVDNSENHISNIISSHTENKSHSNSVEKVRMVVENSTKSKNNDEFNLRGTEKLHRNNYFYDLIKDKKRILQFMNAFNPISMDENDARSIG